MSRIVALKSFGLFFRKKMKNRDFDCVFEHVTIQNFKVRQIVLFCARWERPLASGTAAGWAVNRPWKQSIKLHGSRKIVSPRKSLAGFHGRRFLMSRCPVPLSVVVSRSLVFRWSSPGFAADSRRSPASDPRHPHRSVQSSSSALVSGLFCFCYVIVANFAQVTPKRQQLLFQYTSNSRKYSYY